MNGPDETTDPTRVVHTDALSEAPEGDRPGSAFHAAIARHSGEPVLDDDGNSWSNID